MKQILSVIQKRPISGLPYIVHARLAVEIEIARDKLFHIQNAIFVCYPQKTWRQFSNNLDNSINSLKNLLDEEVFKEHRAFPLKAKAIYYSGIGHKILEYQNKDLSIISYPFPASTRSKKPGITIAQHQRSTRYLAEIEDLFFFIEVTALSYYRHQPRLLETIQKIRKQLDKLKSKLSLLPVKDHSNGESSFAENNIARAFLDGSFNDLTSVAPYFTKYLIAVVTDNGSKIGKLENDLRERVAARSNQTPIRPDQAA